MVKNLPANARDTGSIPDPGRSHMPQATKLMRHKYWAHVLQLLKSKCPWACTPQQEKSLQWACTLQLETRPHSLWLEKALEQQQRPSTDKNKNKYIFLNLKKSIVFLQTSNEHAYNKIKIKIIIPFTMSLYKGLRCVRKHIKSLYAENYTMLMKEIKVLNKWRGVTCLGIGRLKIMC